MGRTIWAENSGDTGSSLATAQVTTGNSTLDLIAGTLANSPNIDMYAIQITDPAAFSATTYSVNGNADYLLNGATHAVQNTMLFLFDSSGRGLVANNDMNSGSTLSALPAGSIAGLTPGIYYLAVSGYATEPYYGNPNAVRVFDFNSTNATDVLGPHSPNRSLAFWETNPDPGDTGGYAITLTGAATVDYVPTSNPAPEPASLLLCVTGGLGLAATRWRRWRRHRRLAD